MLWVETGPHAIGDTWDTRPMQIGNVFHTKSGKVLADPGLHDLLDPKNEHAKLVLPPSYQGKLTMANVRTNGRLNIEAGVGYLLLRLAHFDTVKVDSPSTPQPLQASTLKSHHHNAKERPTYKLSITGWDTRTDELIGKRYNTKMSDYGERLTFCKSIINGQNDVQGKK